MNVIDASQLTGMEPHPVIPIKLPEQLWENLQEEEKTEFYKLRRETLIAEAIDPFRFGYEPPEWARADNALIDWRTRFPKGPIQQLCLGGNRAGKTHRAAKRIMQIMVNKPGARVWCLQSTETTSRAEQQPLIFAHIPAEWRPDSGKLKEGRSTKINYSVAGGFTENTFVLPNGSQCWFKYYSQDVKSIEGAELDMAWPDELVTSDWIEALRFRLVTRDGVLLITFTPIEGYSQTVKEYLDNATTIQETEAELLPLRDANMDVCGFEKVPRLQQSGRPTASIVYFHTEDNPFGNYEAMKVELDGSPRDRILTRAYGVPTKAMLTQFPMWSDMVHIISLNKWREIEKLGGTRLHFLDPCSGRNWFMIWVMVDALERAFIYREWPSYGHESAYIEGYGNIGEWTVPGKPADGERGPAQRELGWGLKRYISEIERLETLSGDANTSGRTSKGDGKDEKCGQERCDQNGEVRSVKSAETTLPAQDFQSQREQIFERWMDGRYGNATKTATEESTTLIEELADLGMDFLAAPSEVSVSISARGGGEGLRLINDALYYDKSRPIDHTNQPHLYVVETCPNVIYALKNYTGRDGLHGACKDPIDTLRMFKLCGTSYCDERMLQVRKPWEMSHKLR